MNPDDKRSRLRVTSDELNNLEPASKEIPEEPPLSEEFLNAIGKRIHEERALALPLHSQLAVCWKEIIEHGLPDEEKINIMKRYSLPENCLFNVPPKINSEIKSVLQAPVISRDSRIIIKEEKISASLSAIAKALSLIMKNEKFMNDIPVVECLSDSIKLLVDLQRSKSTIRRSLIIANIKLLH